VTDIVNGLTATPRRRALLKLIDAEDGRIYGEANQVWDKVPYLRVTAEVKKFLAADWVRALAPDEPRKRGESKHRAHYRLTDYGRVALGIKNSTKEQSNG
jgi:hypothetical protein